MASAVTARLSATSQLLKPVKPKRPTGAPPRPTLPPGMPAGPKPGGPVMQTLMWPSDDAGQGPKPGSPRPKWPPIVLKPLPKPKWPPIVLKPQPRPIDVAIKFPPIKLPPIALPGPLKTLRFPSDDSSQGPQIKLS